MAFDYINEAFKKLDLLEEEMFDTSLQGVNRLADFIQEEDPEVNVIDPEASTEEELQDSYVGKVIINCNVCHSHIFENKEEIVIDEEGTLNPENPCPYCGESEGFTIVGEIAPYNYTSEGSQDETTVPEDETTVLEEPADVHEGMSLATKRLVSEDFKEVTITTDDQHMEMTSDDNGKVTVTTEPIDSCVEEECEDAAETIVPLSDETETEILANNDIETEPTEAAPVEQSEPSDEASEDAATQEEIDLEEVDEEGMDELGESYFKTVYENVESFKTTDVSCNDTTLIVEGLITFASGAQKKTGFVFESKDFNSRGQVRFVGSNKHLSESTNAFSLVGKIDSKKLFVESLRYNYTVDNSTVRGIVRRK